MGYVYKNVELFLKEKFSALSCFALGLGKWSGKK